MVESDFAQQATALLGRIQDALDRAFVRHDLEGDCELEGGVLRVGFADDSRMVINLQPALREIWVASRRGGFHFRRDAQGQWIDTRDGCTLVQRLAAEVSHHAGLAVQFDAL